MSPQQTGAVSDLNPIKVLVLALAILLGLFAVTKVALSGAQDSQEPTEWRVKKVGPKRVRAKAKEPDYPVSERILEDQIPLHLPIKVELKNLKTNSLLRDIEIKVTNEAKKPIFFLELGLRLPYVLSPDGYPINFPLRYGRTELIDFDEPLQPNDVPLQPGESFTFKVAEENLGPFERLAAKGKLSRTEVRIIYLVFHQINFGDKTGFGTTGGSPVPSISKERTSLG